MSRSRTRRRARRARRNVGRWSHRLAWLLGAALVCAGALTGAFGTVAWLSVLCAGSFARMMLGILALGVAPVVGGGALLWAGLSVLEGHAARSRASALTDERYVEAVRGGATSATVALRLGVADAREVERRLDDLVARDAVVLAVSDDGELVYQEPAS